MMPKTAHRIALLDYPGASRAAIEGLREMLTHADQRCAEQGRTRLAVVVVGADLPSGPPFAAVVVPPAFGDRAFLTPDARMVAWLSRQQAQGAMMASACAGAFYLGASGALDGRRVTTHWALADRLAARFPAASVEPEHVTLSDGALITAGGLFSWIDLGLELTARLACRAIMRELGRFFVIDTGRRDQRHYRSFHAPDDHGDRAILRAQRLLEADPVYRWRIPALAVRVALSERSLLRRFTAATGRTPLSYLQALRIRAALDRLADSSEPIAMIALAVGYENANAFRKIFRRETGLSPSGYRQRLGR